MPDPSAAVLASGVAPSALTGTRTAPDDRDTRAAEEEPRASAGVAASASVAAPPSTPSCPVAPFAVREAMRAAFCCGSVGDGDPSVGDGFAPAGVVAAFVPRGDVTPPADTGRVRRDDGDAERADGDRIDFPDGVPVAQHITTHKAKLGDPLLYRDAPSLARDDGTCHHTLATVGRDTLWKEEGPRLNRFHSIYRSCCAFGRSHACRRPLPLQVHALRLQRQHQHRCRRRRCCEPSGRRESVTGAPPDIHRRKPDSVKGSEGRCEVIAPVHMLLATLTHLLKCPGSLFCLPVWHGKQACSHNAEQHGLRSGHNKSTLITACFSHL